MTKIETLDKLALIREAVAALPDEARPIMVSVGTASEYIQLSRFGAVLEPDAVDEHTDCDFPGKEYTTDIMWFSVCWFVPLEDE